jgi:uncharacterized membrane protein
MMVKLLPYLATLVVFGLLDGLWLWTMSGRIYRPVLGDILLADLRVAPAIAFYLAYPAGLTLLAVVPALRAGDWSTALINGAMLGALAYGTYDLTNYATLRNWTLEITVIDIAYGTAVAAVASLAGFLAARMVSAGGPY